jgi:hypothetical protein
MRVGATLWPRRRRAGRVIVELESGQELICKGRAGGVSPRERALRMVPRLNAIARSGSDR